MIREPFEFNVDEDRSESDVDEYTHRPLEDCNIPGVGSDITRQDVLGVVLVVDDSHLNRKMMCMLLKDKVMQLLQAEDGVIAVDVVRSRLAANQSVDVILMDFMMPHMTGPQATAAIRSMGYKGVIIGVTGNAVTADINTFVASGANKVLLKPVEFDNLEAAIRGTLSTASSRSCSL
jgi:CheY-like chemotaxis protein